ncbi:MAG: (Fe-S)-binding protein [Ignavibacteria bacterium]|nr:(Fe-S)-binding protein [Ignavibacteria bacterium]MBI3765033.1 (Fe-S)-binding protein [Ignavibacteriales bacterium]
MSDATLRHIDDVLSHCIHCGMCLPVCPTYAMTYQEQSSPRGRIRLIRSLHDGSLQLSDEFVNEMYFCLDCQACQTACPAGVQYGSLVEDARHIISQQGQEPLSLRLFKKLFLRGVLASKSRTKMAARLMKLYFKSGLQDAVDQSGILSLFSDRIHAKHQLLPQVSDEFFDDDVPEVISPKGKPLGRVAFLSGCIMNVAFPSIHRDAVGVLVKAGYEVVIPKEQVCCGSLHGHNGDVEGAKSLARNNIEAFEKHNYEALIVDSAGCGAFLKEYGRLFADDAEYASRAAEISKKSKDVTEFLAGIELPKPITSLNKRVTYHDACHLVHTQKISHEPRRLITSIPGVEFVELPESTWCCGSAGIYNIVRFDDSMKLLERKMENLASTHADIVATANPGCHLQLHYGIKKFGLKMEVMHPVSLLARAYLARLD